MALQENLTCFVFEGFFFNLIKVFDYYEEAKYQFILHTLFKYITQRMTVYNTVCIVW